MHTGEKNNQTKYLLLTYIYIFLNFGRINHFIRPQNKTRQLNTHQPWWKLCGDLEVNHTHVFWSCTNVDALWDNVTVTIANIM